MNALNRELYTRLRDQIHGTDLIYHIYHNYKGKNFWNIICSAVEWIDVVIDEIDCDKLSKTNDNSSSVKLMTFIMCIDVLTEAVNQLHRVFIDETTVPYINDCSVFKHRAFEMDDNKYFKTIRACFAAHQINLNDYFTNNTNKERRYAGWSSTNICNRGFSIALYSNNPDVETILLDISANELFAYAAKRYNYLETIIERINIQVNDYLSNWRNRTIVKAESPIEQIQILIQEEKSRFDNDYLAYALNKLLIVFSTTVHGSCNKAIVDTYRNANLTRIQEMYDCLQKMELSDLPSDKTIDDSAPSEYRYLFEKLFNMVMCNESGNEFAIDILRNKLSTVIDFDSILSVAELFVVLLAKFYEMNSSN